MKAIEYMEKYGFIGVYVLPFVFLVTIAQKIIEKYALKDQKQPEHTPSRMIETGSFNLSGRGTNAGRLYDHLDTQYFRCHAGSW